MSETRLGADRTNALVEQITKRFWAKVDMLVAMKMADGYPPFTEKLTPAEQYQQLVAARDAGDPAYWSDPRSQAKLMQLAQRFGTPAPINQPFGVAAAGSPSSTFRATQDVNNVGEPPIGGV